MTTNQQTPTSATGTYRLPRRLGQQCSTYLYLHWDGQEALMEGGKGGDHRITTTDIKRVQAHWNGYVSNSRGHAVTPTIHVNYAE